MAAAALITLLSSNLAANEIITSAVDQYVRVQTRGLPGRVDVTVAALDPRTQVSSARHSTLYASGNRLWGKTMVGVRCLAPAAWTIYVRFRCAFTRLTLSPTAPSARGSCFRRPIWIAGKAT